MLILIVKLYVSPGQLNYSKQACSFDENVVQQPGLFWWDLKNRTPLTCIVFFVGFKK